MYKNDTITLNIKSLQVYEARYIDMIESVAPAANTSL